LYLRAVSKRNVTALAIAYDWNGDVARLRTRWQLYIVQKS